MSAIESYDRPHQLLSPGEAQRLTQRIKLTAGSIRDGLFKLRNLVDEAKASNVWQVLGFPSWTAYLADALGSEPMRLGRDERRELVDYLAGEGMSTRAIAPIVGTSQKTVDREVRAARESNDSPQVPLSAAEPVSTSPEVVEPEGEVTGDVEPPNPPSPVTVNPATGEIIDAPTVTEHTVTEKTRTVVGLDGKTYNPKPKKPKPVLKNDALARYDAETAAKSIGSALLTLSHMITPAYREEVISRYWPAGNDAVPPDVRALFAPTPIRDIAAALLELAHELEVHQ